MIDLLIFLVGLQLGITWIAAAYGFVDLWYCIRQKWPGVLGGFLTATGLIAVIAWLLPETRLPALVWGLGVMAALHIGGYALSRIGLAIAQRRSGLSRRVTD